MQNKYGFQSNCIHFWPDTVQYEMVQHPIQELLKVPSLSFNVWETNENRTYLKHDIKMALSQAIGRSLHAQRGKAPDIKG